MERLDVRGKKVPVKGGGICIYCGWDGGESGLHDEHIVPYALGGNTELLKASCSNCEAVTSYLDGYMANAVYGHFRVHLNLQSRSGHAEVLPTTVDFAHGKKVFDLMTRDHPYFLNMPVWNPPGVMRGVQISDGFTGDGTFTFWYIPPNIEQTIGLADGEKARIIDTSPKPNLRVRLRIHFSGICA